MTDPALPRWGTVTTAKAPLDALQRFAAWHLEQGAARICIYLDETAPRTEAALAAHPHIRVMHTDEAYWAKRKGRPEKHQVRQSLNARHANNRNKDLDWLTHIDVDEFLLPARPVARVLADLPDTALCARIRPVEALAPGSGSTGGETLFKAFHLKPSTRQDAAEDCFPNWGRHLSGGFLSHVAGKLFFRAGTPGLQVRIHKVLRDGVENPGQIDLADIELGHFHAADWDHFRAAFRFRMDRGSYRPGLKPQVRRGQPLPIHDLLAFVEAETGEAGLRAFFEEVCTANAPLCARLDAHGLLRRHRMDLETLRARHFPATA